MPADEAPAARPESTSATTFDEYGRPIENGVPNDPISRVFEAGVHGAAQGWRDTPGFLAPTAQSWLDRVTRGTPNKLAGAVKIADAAMGAMNGGFKGVQEAAVQAGNEIGQPDLGRDLAGYMEMSMGQPSLHGMTGIPRVAEPPPLPGAPRGSVPSAGGPPPEPPPAPPIAPGRPMPTLEATAAEAKPPAYVRPEDAALAELEPAPQPAPEPPAVAAAAETAGAKPPAAAPEADATLQQIASGKATTALPPIRPMSSNVTPEQIAQWKVEAAERDRVSPQGPLPPIPIDEAPPNLDRPLTPPAPVEANAFDQFDAPAPSPRGPTPFTAAPKGMTKPLDAVSFLASQGGIRPDGDLLAMDAHKINVPFVGKLVKSDGMSLNDAREQLQENGYALEDPTDDRSVYKIIDEHVSGPPDLRGQDLAELPGRPTSRRITPRLGGWLGCTEFRLLGSHMGSSWTGWRTMFCRSIWRMKPSSRRA